MSTSATLKGIKTKLKKVKAAVNKQSGSGRGKDKPYDLEDTKVREALNDIEEVFSELVKLLEDGEGICPKVKELEASNKKLEDEVDHLGQKQLKGKFMVNTVKNSSIIKTEQELQQEGTSLTTHIQNLVQMKLGVEVPAEDISSCHRTNSGLMFRLSNFKPESSFHAVVEAIKSGKNKDVLLFFNFALTKKRAALLYEVRMLKKAGKIYKFYTDYDGQITYKETQDSKKTKLSSVKDKKNSAPWTSTILELRESLNQV